MSGDDDFFSVAKTIPLVAGKVNTNMKLERLEAACRLTFDSKGCYTLVHCVESILYWIPALLARSSGNGYFLMIMRCIGSTAKERRTDLYELPTVIELAGWSKRAGVAEGWSVSTLGKRWSVKTSSGSAMATWL